MGLRFGSREQQALDSGDEDKGDDADTGDFDASTTGEQAAAHKDARSPVDPTSLPHSSLLLQGSMAASSTDRRDSSTRDVRVWTKEDRGDLNKLDTMISSFLGVPQFAANLKFFSSRVITPLMHTAGPQPGSIQILTQVMQSVMVRHRFVFLSLRP